MSQFGSDSDISVVSIKVKEEFDDDVSVHSASEQTSWGTVIFKFTVGILFLCAGAGAIVYCVNNSTGPKKEAGHGSFPFDRNQMGDGKLNIFMRNADGNNENTPSFSSSVKWIQDADNKRLMYKIGGVANWTYSLFAFEDVSYNASSMGCTIVVGMNYDNFFDRMGLRYLDFKNTESVKIEGKYKEALIYEGEPDNTATYYGAHPSLVRGYSPTEGENMYGWETYFSYTSSMFKVEHWIPEMTAKTSSVSIYDYLPSNCLAHQGR